MKKVIKAILCLAVVVGLSAGAVYYCRQKEEMAEKRKAEKASEKRDAEAEAQYQNEKKKRAEQMLKNRTASSEGRLISISKSAVKKITSHGVIADVISARSDYYKNDDVLFLKLTNRTKSQLGFNTYRLRKQQPFLCMNVDGKEVTDSRYEASGYIFPEETAYIPLPIPKNAKHIVFSMTIMALEAGNTCMNSNMDITVSR